MNAPEKDADNGTDATAGDGTTTGDGDEATAPPVLRVVSGNPTAEELALITAVVAAASAGGNGDPAPPAQRSLWSRTSRVPGHRLPPGPGAWRASGLPR